MSGSKSYLFTLVLFVTAMSSVVAHSAFADGKKYTASDPVWKEECGSCHIAYPPRLLPGSAWRELMASLDRHFGTDASIDLKTAKHIAGFLENNAGRERVSRQSSSLRITDTRWFLHEHDEVPTRVWNNPRVKTAANCQACHVNASSGDFDEHSVRLPR